MYKLDKQKDKSLDEIEKQYEAYIESNVRSIMPGPGSVDVEHLAWSRHSLHNTIKHDTIRCDTILVDTMPLLPTK